MQSQGMPPVASPCCSDRGSRRTRPVIEIKHELEADIVDGPSAGHQLLGTMPRRWSESRSRLRAATTARDWVTLKGGRAKALRTAIGRSSLRG